MKGGDVFPLAIDRGPEPPAILAQLWEAPSDALTRLGSLCRLQLCSIISLRLRPALSLSSSIACNALFTRWACVRSAFRTVSLISNNRRLCTVLLPLWLVIFALSPVGLGLEGSEFSPSFRLCSFLL